ncbi:hypothetical protein [Falsirhodobacter xinxiangensis]|uniref:hypothetical protein n=1 Tax=Falsirhodobacter xinxiangensis TaxID=2530049 RepID=UPI00145A1066|nr:hypothetical protein [Rhodobacter xinxiangensis]
MPAIAAIVIALALASAGAASGGVYLLFGLGWALICGAAFLMFFAAILSRGVTNG